MVHFDAIWHTIFILYIIGTWSLFSEEIWKTRLETVHSNAFWNTAQTYIIGDGQLQGEILKSTLEMVNSDAFNTMNYS